MIEKYDALKQSYKDAKEKLNHFELLKFNITKTEDLLNIFHTVDQFYQSSEDYDIIIISECAFSSIQTE